MKYADNEIYVIVDDCHLQPIYYAETEEELKNYILGYIENEFQCEDKEAQLHYYLEYNEFPDGIKVYQISKVPTSPQ